MLAYSFMVIKLPLHNEWMTDAKIVQSPSFSPGAASWFWIITYSDMILIIKSISKIKQFKFDPEIDTWHVSVFPILILLNPRCARPYLAIITTHFCFPGGDSFLWNVVDVFVEWEGGDEWIRAQFKDYLQSLMATVLAEGLYKCCRLLFV